jgi:hypothetical protein
VACQRLVNAVTGCAVKGDGPQREYPARELVRSTR